MSIKRGYSDSRITNKLQRDKEDEENFQNILPKYLLKDLDLLKIDDNTLNKNDKNLENIFHNKEENLDNFLFYDEENV
jgi:ankyrin repeat protein